MTMIRNVPRRLVRIDVATLTYTLFVEKKDLHIVKAEAPLLPEEIELFRTRPELLIQIEPETA